MDLSSFVEKFRPFGASVGKQFTQVQQLAREKMGGNVDTTELPPEYKELEDKVDKIKHLHENFIKVARNFTLPHYDYQPPVGDSVMDFASSASASFRKVSSAGAKAAGIAPPYGREEDHHSEIPPSLNHALGSVAYDSSSFYTPTEPMGQALKKFSDTQDKIGNYRLTLASEATSKFYQPFVTTLNQSIAHAMKARKNVSSVRLTYDYSRAKVKTAKPENAEIIKAEMEAAEDEFVAAVDDAMGKMKAVCESLEPLKNLADLCAAQLKFYKHAYEAMAELSPEIDELQVTNEALLRKQ